MKSFYLRGILLLAFFIGCFVATVVHGQVPVSVLESQPSQWTSVPVLQSTPTMNYQLTTPEPIYSSPAPVVHQPIYQTYQQTAQYAPQRTIQAYGSGITPNQYQRPMPVSSALQQLAQRKSTWMARNTYHGHPPQATTGWRPAGVGEGYGFSSASAQDAIDRACGSGAAVSGMSMRNGHSYQTGDGTPRVRYASSVSKGRDGWYALILTGGVIRQ